MSRIYQGWKDNEFVGSRSVLEKRGDCGVNSAHSGEWVDRRSLVWRVWRVGFIPPDSITPRVITVSPTRPNAEDPG
jgi:hypothetical protein